MKINGNTQMRNTDGTPVMNGEKMLNITAYPGLRKNVKTNIVWVCEYPSGLHLWTLQEWWIPMYKAEHLEYAMKLVFFTRVLDYIDEKMHGWHGVDRSGISIPFITDDGKTKLLPPTYEYFMTKKQYDVAYADYSK